jgi:dTDP-4-dehydrorhamnose 3,5-epimerase
MNIMTTFEPLKLAGTYAVRLKTYPDDRGYLVVTYADDVFEKQGLVTDWVQDNQSESRLGVIRGLHFQRPPHTETKLVRVVVGAVWDVFVDLRRASPTYGQWDAIELSAENHTMAYIPRGFAHGFAALTERAVVAYKVDRLFAPSAAGGIRWDDPTIAIPWPRKSPPVISDRDRSLPLLAEIESPF